MTRRTTALIAVALLGACGKKQAPAADTSTATTATTAIAPRATLGACPRTGHWGDCQLSARLGASGLAPHTTTEKIGDLPALPVPPNLLTIGKSGLAFYVFPDTLSRRKAAASLDAAKFIPQSQPVSAKSVATLIENDNMLVLLFSINEHQRERVADAVTAGPPQP